VNAGGLGTARARSRLRSAVNARLEEISFRTGLITATIGLIALAAIAAAGVFAATLSLGGQAIAAAGALSSVSAPKTIPAVTASAQPITYPQASSTPSSTPQGSTLQGSTPQARHPVTAATTSPQSAAGSQPWPQAGAPQAGSRYYGQAGDSHTSWYGTHGSWYGTHGSWYGANWPRHGGFGFPAHGFGFPRSGGLGR
jgi:hypothetical protein